MTNPDRYIHGHHESVLRSHSWRTVENSAAYLIPELRPGLDVLDVGSGPGTITLDLARRVAPGQVVGVDVSPDAVERSIRNAREQGVDNVRFVAASAYELPLADDSFDIVHAHQVLQHVTRPVDLLRELRRVVRPGGVVAARDVDWSGIVTYPQLPELERWKQLFHAVHLGHGGQPDAGRRLKSWALEAGFGSVDAGASAWGFGSDTDRAWWGETSAQRVLASTFAGDVQQLGFADADELERISQAWLTWRDDPNGMLIMPHGEILARD